MNEPGSYEKIAEASKTIFSYCMAKTPTREDAEDLSQDILYELTKSAGSIRDDKAFYGFMWAVAGNVYKQWYRKKLRSGTSELTDDIPAEDDFPEDETEDLFLLRRELSLLSEKYRKATILYYIKDRSCSEIAGELCISESMVKYLLFKSRKILKEGMNMERNLGELSYNPKTLFPMYSGQGPNRFWDFMQSRIRQNIFSACYNDALTVQQISLETGIPLPYLEDDIRAMEDKKILVKDGTHYRANVLVITADCTDEMERAAVKYHERIADKMEEFLNNTMDEYRNLGFTGRDFTENTLRWQLAVLLFRTVAGIDVGECGDMPVTGWGEGAYIWCMEKTVDSLFNFCGCGSKRGDSLYFFDYLKGGKGDHHDFYGNEHRINLFCDICRGEAASFGDYDLEAVAEMIRKGYVVREGDTYRAAVPVYTAEQYRTIMDKAWEFVTAELSDILREMDKTAAKILGSHTPKHLQNQVAGIASMDKFVNAVSAPAGILLERKVLTAAWHPLEMPTTYVVIG